MNSFSPAGLGRRDFLLALGASGAACWAASVARGAQKPNVVFILADDLGWRDTSGYGSDYYRTPHIDALASRGMIFRQAYAANPLCSPTRASVLTGLYPARIGLTSPAGHVEQVQLEKKLREGERPDRRSIGAVSLTRLKTEYYTLAEALGDVGYATAHLGKWHLGREPYDPLRQGFDIDLPHTHVSGPPGGYLAPWEFWPGQGKDGEHIEDRMAEEAERFIIQNKDQPFFLNYWAFTAHTPWSAKSALVDHYAQHADPSNPQRNPVTAAMIHSLDEAVGRITRAIDNAGVADRTIVVFFSDNGGVEWGSAEEPKMMHPSYRNLPATSNAPLRGGKATLYEGGTRVPCIVVCPGETKAGSTSEEMISSIDFYPTILALAGLRKQRDQEFDGISLVPALRGEKLNREALFCHFPAHTPRTANVPGTWVRKGDWKLIRYYHDNEDQSDRFELYNLKDDLGELRNLAARYPEKVTELNALIDGFLDDTEAVVPRPNPAYQGGAG